MTHPPLPAWIPQLLRIALSAIENPVSGPGEYDPIKLAPGLMRWRSFRGGASISHTNLPVRMAPDERVWAALVREESDVESLWNEVRRSAVERSEADQGSLLPRSAYDAIEVWTESELSALHAFAWHALRVSDRSMLDRILDVGAWHIEHLQPDNATNRPWAVHVFLILSRERALPEAGFHAQTLLHNCQVSHGRPDALSAHVLRDAAEALETWCARLGYSKPKVGD